jgi:hypothetical protein
VGAVADRPTPTRKEQTVNTDTMTDDQIARHVRNTATSREITDIADRLQRRETANPGTILAVANMTPEASSEFLWSLRRGNTATNPILVFEAHEFTADGGEWRIRDASSDGAYATVTPTHGVAAVALTPSGHCPVGSECDICQWDAMSPAERAEVDRRCTEESAQRNHVGRSGEYVAPIPQPEGRLADWELDLLP